MTEFARWHKWFCRERGHKPDAWDAWHGALQYIKESRPTVRKAVQQRKGVICPCCDGEGRLPDTHNGGTKRCEYCKGTGRLSPVA
jgi:DnaJ-class molecular chaperone